MRRKCPHPDVANCPLYHAAHVPNAAGCFSKKMDTGLCAVDLGESYSGRLAKLQREHPQIVAECEWHVMTPARTLH